MPVALSCNNRNLIIGKIAQQHTTTTHYIAVATHQLSDIEYRVIENVEDFFLMLVYFFLCYFFLEGNYWCDEDCVHCKVPRQNGLGEEPEILNIFLNMQSKD